MTPSTSDARFEAERVGNDVDDLSLPADRVEDLDLSPGVSKDPDVPGLTTAASVENRAVEFDALRGHRRRPSLRPSTDRHLGRQSLLSSSGGSSEW